MKQPAKYILPILTGLLLLISPTILSSQNSEVLEIEADPVESISDPEIRIFYDKFHQWVQSVQNKSEFSYPPKDDRVNNFLIFTETGIIMKDLKFHTAESCKQHILNSLPAFKSTSATNAWIYVSLESHVDRHQLSTILNFLREHQIEYYFTTEDRLEEIIEQN